MKNKKPTLLILTPGFAADEMDTTCLPAQQTFIKALKEDFPKLNIVILTFEYPFFKGIYKWQGLDVISLNGHKKRKLFRLLLWIKAMKQLRKIHHENNLIGILSFWCGECAWIGKKFSRKHNIKHYCWLRGQDARKGNKYVKWMRPSENELIALSDFLQSEFEKNYLIRPSFVIPPGIDTNQFCSTITKKDIDILGAGSLIPLKQYDLFIEVINELKKKIPGIRVILCGKGSEESNLQQQIETFHLQNAIILTGEIPHPEVLQLMQRSKVFLHTSSYEGFGGVCLEALYAGAHVISFIKIMNENIPHWHIVNSKEEMIELAFEVLTSAQIEYSSVSVYPKEEISKKVMGLFDL